MRTMQEFYDYVVKIPPYDLSNNTRGFNRPNTNCAYSCHSAHIPILRYIASQCEHVTEFGLREGFSTAALSVGLGENNSSKRELHSYDIIYQQIHSTLQGLTFPCSWQFHLGDVANSNWHISETDFLYVDDLHTYNQVKTELDIHGRYVKRFLGFHDVFSQGINSLDRPGEEGINRAICEYTSANGFKSIYYVEFNHGLWIFERK
jgi:hypothetical protein